VQYVRRNRGLPSKNSRVMNVKKTRSFKIVRRVKRSSNVKRVKGVKGDLYLFIQRNAVKAGEDAK